MAQYDEDAVPRAAHVKNGKPISSKTSQFTQRELKLKSNWEDWRAAEWKQLDEIVRCNMFGNVVMRHQIRGLYDVIHIV